MSQSPHRTIRGVGARIRELRALRAYSLRELAQRAHVSAAMLSRVERGLRAPSEQVMAAVARALSVSVTALHGQPYIEQLRQDQLDRLIAPLSTALDDWGIPPEDDAPPRPPAGLRDEITTVQRLRTDADYGRLAELLPGLLAGTSYSALLHDTPGRDREAVHWVQTEAALGAFAVAYKFGYTDLARLALARMAAAAAQSGDPRQVAAERVKRAQLCAEGPAMERGLRLVRQGLRDLGDDGTPQTRAVRGGLLLKGAQMNGLLGDGDESEAYLDEARGLARQLGETNHHLFVFGPTNTEQHAISSAGDRGRHGLAVKLSRAVRLPEDYPAARAGVYWIDTPRSLALTARHDEALDALHEARRVSRQQTRYHPTTRTTVGVLLRAKPRAPERLRAFARWSGV